MNGKLLQISASMSRGLGSKFKKDQLSAFCGARTSNKCFTKTIQRMGLVNQISRAIN